VERLALIERARSGNQDAFRALYEADYPDACRTARLIVRDPHLAEDIAQETFAACYRQLGRLKEAAAYTAWFHRVLLREAWRQSKQARRHTAAGEAALDPADPHPGFRPAEAFAVLEQENAVAAAVGRLDFKRRITVILFYYRELSLSEIATATGVPEGTVKSRLHSARRLLGQDLAARDSGPATPSAIPATAADAIKRSEPCATQC
jgi:RNA polymerase sigma-70 factor (ECF subfamily)